MERVTQVLLKNGYTDEDILASYGLLYRGLSHEDVRDLIAKAGARITGRVGDS
jgi:hypothetical protein